MRKKRLICLLIFVLAFIIIGNGCRTMPSDVQIQDVSHMIQSGKAANTDTHDGFYFEQLNYHKQCLYMNNEYTLSKWVYENDAYTCEQTIPLSQLFPQEYQNTDRIIAYLKHGEINTLSCDGRFVCLYNAQDPSAVYFWDTDADALYCIQPSSPIRKIQWADDKSLLFMLTEENMLYCINPVSKNVTVTAIKAKIPDVSEQNIHLLNDGVIYVDGLRVLCANDDSEPQVIVDHVIEFFGVYKNTLVIKRTDNKVEAGFIEAKWNPFYSERINDCYPVNGPYLQLDTTENQVDFIDLMSGRITSLRTGGYGYEVFPNTNAILFFDNDGTPYVQKPDASPMPIQRGYAEPFLNDTALISILTHDDKMSLQLFSDDQWLMFNIDTK